jgi:hypothetical protein
MSDDDDDKIPLTPRGRVRSQNPQLIHITRRAGPGPKELDLVHVTAAGWAAEILRESGQIETRRCDIFNQDLVYFFVARAAFRPKRGDTGSDDITRFPVAFVVRPDKLPAPAHIYPFDTGAAVGGRYLNARQSGVFLEDYALDPSLDAVRRLIDWAFGTYRAYLDADLKVDLDVAHHEYVIRSYLRIARLAGSRENLPDPRASSIEVAYREHVKLKGHAKLVVLPEQLLEPASSSGTGTGLRARLEAHKLNFRTYTWMPGKSPDSYMDEVARLVRSGLRGVR